MAHAPFDPAGPGTIKSLHHRLMKVHEQVEPTMERIGDSLRVGPSGSRATDWDSTTPGWARSRMQPRTGSTLWSRSLRSLALPSYPYGASGSTAGSVTVLVLAKLRAVSCGRLGAGPSIAPESTRSWMPGNLTAKPSSCESEYTLDGGAFSSSAETKT